MLITPFVIIGGLVIGLLIAVPPGPANVLCIQRTLQRGFWGGFATGLGAVIGDGILAATAVFGIKAVSTIFIAHKMTILLLGGILLIAFGIHLFFKKPIVFDTMDEMAKLSKNAGAITQSFVFTVTNPGILIFIFALFGGLVSWIGVFDVINAFILVLAVMSGSLVWWFGLSWLVSVVRHRLKEVHLNRINQATALSLIVFGFILLIKILF